MAIPTVRIVREQAVARRTQLNLYVPPYPPRPKTAGSSLWVVLTAGRNLVALWPDFAFELNSFSFKILMRRIHVLSTPDTVRQIFVDEGMRYLTKTPQQRQALETLIGDGLFLSDGETWRIRRRVVAPTTHISRLAELAPAITAGAEALRAEWLENEGQEIDALTVMAELTAGIIGRAVFGRHLSRASTQELIAAFGVYQSLIGQTDILSMLNLPSFLPRFKAPRAVRAARRIQVILDRLIDDVFARSDADESSLIRSMTQAVAEGDVPPIGREGLRNEAAVLFMAGHETTANTLAWAWFILSQDEESERRLHAEVDGVLGDAPAGYEDYERLPFTRAVIEETMRLYPPIPLQARLATQDGTLGGKTVKKGDLLVLNAWLLHRHRKLWPDPDAFVPERFLPGGGAPPSRYAYVPFSIGPRVCTGAAFGLMEATLCLATLTRRLRLRLRKDWSVMPSARLSLRPGERLPMTIERRTPA